MFGNVKDRKLLGQLARAKTSSAEYFTATKKIANKFDKAIELTLNLNLPLNWLDDKRIRNQFDKYLSNNELELKDIPYGLSNKRLKT